MRRGQFGVLAGPLGLLEGFPDKGYLQINTSSGIFDLDSRTFVEKSQGRVERPVKVLEEQRFGFDCVDRNVIFARSVYVNVFA